MFGDGGLDLNVIHRHVVTDLAEVDAEDEGDEGDEDADDDADDRVVVEPGLDEGVRLLRRERPAVRCCRRFQAAEWDVGDGAGGAEVGDDGGERRRRRR